ncbi:MAG: hypothetical protein ACJ77Z_06580 [Thermoleophilaceae bacterium]
MNSRKLIALLNLDRQSLERNNMLRSSRIAAAGVIVAALVAASSATATTPPSGNGLRNLPVICDGHPTTLTVSRGAAFYVDGQKYVLQSLTIVNGPLSLSKDYGNRTGLTGGSIVCSGSVTDEYGTTNFAAIGVSSK